MKKGIVYYTDNAPREKFLKVIRTHLKRVCADIPIVWVSQKPIPEKNNIVISGIGRSHHSRCLQILIGLRHIKAGAIFFAEHDIIYHPSHFDFTPEEKDIFYYNTNRWWLRSSDGQASYRKNRGALSQLVAHKGIIKDFFVRRVAFYDRGEKVRCANEPGKNNIPEMPDYKIGFFRSKWPNIDIRHAHNYTKSDKFKSGYILQDGIPGWGKTKGRYNKFMKKLIDKGFE